MDLIRTLTNAQMKSDLPEIKTGDTVKVSAKVVEGNRERIQVFEGTVMRLRGGGLGLNITVRRIASGVGVERTFKVHSPRIEKIEVVKAPTADTGNVESSSCTVGEKGRWLMDGKPSMPSTAAALEASASS